MRRAQADTWILIAEAAAALQVSRQRVHQILADLQIQPARVLGRCVLTPAQLATCRRRSRNKGGRPRKVQPAA